MSDKSFSKLSAISPIDGRYSKKTQLYKNIFSEYGLIRYRVLIEIKWLKSLCENPSITEAESLSTRANLALEKIIDSFSLEDAQEIKNIEETTNHDVKAVEYFLHKIFKNDTELSKLIPFIHFCCTSEDINNLAHGLMLHDAREDILRAEIKTIISDLKSISSQYANIPMLSRTHGQAATPTTLGKEMANFAFRVSQQYDRLGSIKILGKINGAVGNYNAHLISYPDVDWPDHCHKFVSQIGLNANPYTTQIEPHDYMAEYFNALSLLNTILIDLCRDIWGYISIGYFKQKMVKGEIGSSTMPHKVNPIDFENAEGNFGLSNSLLIHFATKLPISRWQRDLTDSTVLRNMGAALAYSSIGYQSLTKGLSKLEIDTTKLEDDLDCSYEVLAEAIQTVMRKYKIDNPYEKLKELTRGTKLTKNSMTKFIENLNIPSHEKHNLKKLTPNSYLGNAEKKASDITNL